MGDDMDKDGVEKDVESKADVIVFYNDWDLLSVRHGSLAKITVAITDLTHRSLHVYSFRVSVVARAINISTCSRLSALLSVKRSLNG